MRYGSVSGLLAVFTHGGAVDVEEASGGRFGPGPQGGTLTQNFVEG